MTNLGKLMALGAMLLCLALPAKGADGFEASWLHLIKADFDKSCVVERVRVGTVLAANNGLRKEQWFMRTCLGDLEYWVAYYPPAAFPDRASPYEVTRVAPVSGTRPNNSFKPKPLRGSA